MFSFATACATFLVRYSILQVFRPYKPYSSDMFTTLSYTGDLINVWKLSCTFQFLNKSLHSLLRVDFCEFSIWFPHSQKGIFFVRNVHIASSRNI